MAGKAWTQQEIDRARGMLLKGHGYEEIAEALGRTYIAVRLKLAGTPPARKQTAATTENAAETRRLRRQVEDLETALKAARQPRVRLKPGKAPRTRKGDFRRVIVPDSHGSHIDPQAAAAFLSDLEELRPAEVVFLGDHLDCGGFLAQHHTLGYVADTEYSFSDDVAAAGAFLDEIQKRAPGADYHYIEGNHERRIEKWIVTQTLRNQRDAVKLREHFSVDASLNLKKRGIRLYEQGKFYGGLSVPSTIKLGKCYFTHGSRTGAHAAAAMLRDFGGNLVYGHTHRADHYTLRTVGAGLIAAWCPGCLCKLQPLWMHTQVTGWSHGYGLQLVRAGGEFLHVNVPIIEGRSFLVPLLRRAS